MSIERQIEIKEGEGGGVDIHFNEVNDEKIPSLKKAFEIYRERYLDLGRKRDTAVLGGLSMGLWGGWLIQYGVVKSDAATGAAGGALLTAGLALSYYGLTSVQEKYKTAQNIFNQLRDRLNSSNQ